MSRLLKRLPGSVWFFPLIIILCLLALTALKISGTSIGIYHNLLFGNTRDHSLILNQPLAVRSDEWLVTSQLTIAQKAAGYPRINHNIDAGRDMSLVGDAPYKEWSTVFRPQNLAFFVMPLEHAFAFKWWSLLFLCMVGGYFLVLRFLPGRRLVAALVSTGFACSPFLFWWYSTSSLGPIAYGLFIMLIGLRIINHEKITGLGRYLERYSDLLYGLGLSYLLICFALILYPPYQIPVAIVVAVFLAGAVLEQYGWSKKLFSKPAWRRLGVFALSLVLAGAVVGVFIQTRPGAINALQNTVYPGKRVVSGGGKPVTQILATYLQPQLQRGDKGMHYYQNQSESSNFILFLPFLLIPGFVLLVYGYRQHHKVDWPLLVIQLCAVLFLLHLFVGGLQPIYKLFMLDKVPSPRIFIGLGFAGLLQLLLIIKSIERLKLPAKSLTLFAGLYTLACILVLAYAGQYTRTHYPGFIHSVVLIAFLALFFSAMLFCFLSKRLVLGASLFLVFSVSSVVHIHPLYRGLDTLDNSKISHAIDAVSKPGDTWATTDNLYFENFVLMSNRKSLSGTKPYPDIAFWRQVEGSKGDFVYNRYAHSLFISVPNFNGPLHLVQPDFFEIGLTCNKFVTDNVDFVLDTVPINQPCMRLKERVTYPSATFFIYEIVPSH